MKSKYLGMTYREDVEILKQGIIKEIENINKFIIKLKEN